MRQAPRPHRRSMLLCAALIVSSTIGWQPAVLIAHGADVVRIVTGTVLENRLGCRRDGACYVVLRDPTERIWSIIYHPGEGEFPVMRFDLMVAGGLVQVGDIIEARGVDKSQRGVLVLNLMSADADLRILKRP